jgi:hypothetical protein
MQSAAWTPKLRGVRRELGDGHDGEKNCQKTYSNEDPARQTEAENR